MSEKNNDIIDLDDDLFAGEDNLTLDDMLEAQDAVEFDMISAIPNPVVVGFDSFDEVLSELSSVDDLLLPMGSTNNQLLLGNSQSDGLLIGDDLSSAEDFLSSLDEVENALMVIEDVGTSLIQYSAEDALLESRAIQTADREIHNALVKIDKFSEEAFKKIRDYLRSPQFDIVPNGKFSSDKYKREQDFRSWLVKQFMNLVQTIEAEQKDIAEGKEVSKFIVDNLTKEEYIIKVYFDIYKEEKIIPKLTDAQKKKTADLIMNFISFSHSVTSVAEREAKLVEYKYDENIKIKPPKLVTNFTYLCECGAETFMPTDIEAGMNRPTMTFLIQKSNGRPRVNLINPPLKCEGCEFHLAIPSMLAEKLSAEMSRYIDTIKARYSEDRIYRPAINDLLGFIPENLHHMFHFENTVKVVDDSVSINNSFMQAGRNYTKLINMWMSQVINEEIKRDLEDVYDSDVDLRDLVSSLSSVSLDKEPDLETYQFVKTLMHYLETFSRFNITYKTDSFYEYCKRADINCKPISDTRAITWMYETSEYLASLKNIYPGDTNITQFHIREEYIPVLNHIIALRLLSNPKLIGPESELSKWIKNPTSTTKKLNTMVNKLSPKMKNLVDRSARDLISRNKFYPLEAWYDLHTLLTKVASENSSEYYEDDYIDGLIDEANIKDQYEFYGSEFSEDEIIKKSYRLDDFEKVFDLYGHFLFTDVIIDLKQRNIGSFIKLIINNKSEYPLLFIRSKKSTTDISKILLKHNPDEDWSRNVLIQAIDNENITSDLLEVREEIGGKGIVENFHSHVDFLRLDTEFNKRFGDLFDDISDGA